MKEINTLTGMYDKYVSNFKKADKEIIKICQDEIKNFIDYTASNTICKRYIFSLNIYDNIMKVAGIDKEEFSNMIKNNKFKNTWEVINDYSNVLLLLIIKFYKEENSKNKFNLVLNLLTFKLYSNLHIKYFKFGCQDSVMSFTLSTLNKYFLLGQTEGDLIKALMLTSLSSNEKYENNLKSEDEKIFADYLLNLRTRINQLVQNLATEYYKVYNEKLYLNANATVYDEEGNEVSGLFNNDSQNIIKIKNQLKTYITRVGMDINIIDKINNITEVKTQVVQKMFLKIMQNHNNTDYLIDSLISSLNVNATICDKNFILNSIQFLNSKYDDNKFKPAVDAILSKEIEEYRTLSSSNSKSRFKRAIAIMFLIYLQKSNCSN